MRPGTQHPIGCQPVGTFMMSELRQLEAFVAAATELHFGRSTAQAPQATAELRWTGPFDGLTLAGRIPRRLHSTARFHPHATFG